MQTSVATQETRRALVAAARRCYRVAAAYRNATDAAVKADLFTAAADAVAAYDAAYFAHYGTPHPACR